MKIKWNLTFLSVSILLAIVIILYVSFSVWIARDVRTILQVGMQPGSGYEKYMSEQAYQAINPLQRRLTNAPYTYDASAHDISRVRPIHFFWIAKASAVQSFQFRSSGDFQFGSVEEVKLTLKLKHGRWVATHVSIAP